MLTETQYKQFRDKAMAKMQRSAPPGAWDRYTAAMAHYKETGRPLSAQASVGRPTEAERLERQKIIDDANLAHVCVRMDVESRLQGWV